MIRIAYFVHGRGKGHAIRTQAVIGGLRESDEVRLFCAGEAWDVLSEVPCAEPLLPCMPGRGMLRSFRLRFGPTAHVCGAGPLTCWSAMGTAPP